MNPRAQAKIISLLILLAGVAVISGFTSSRAMGFLDSLLWAALWRIFGEPAIVEWWSER